MGICGPSTEVLGCTLDDPTGRRAVWFFVGANYHSSTMRAFPFVMTDEARDYLVRGAHALHKSDIDGVPMIVELCWRSGSDLDPNSIETFGICCAPGLETNTLETFELDGATIRVATSIQERYRGRLLTVGYRFDPGTGLNGSRLKEFYFL